MSKSKVALPSLSKRDLEQILKNPILIGIVAIIAVVYGSYLAPKLPTWAVLWFENPLFKILFLFLVMVVHQVNPTVSIVLAIVFVLGLHFLSDNDPIPSQFELEPFYHGAKQHFDDTALSEHFQKITNVGGDPPTSDVEPFESFFDMLNATGDQTQESANQEAIVRQQAEEAAKQQAEEAIRRQIEAEQQAAEAAAQQQAQKEAHDQAKAQAQAEVQAQAQAQAQPPAQVQVLSPAPAQAQPPAQVQAQPPAQRARPSNPDVSFDRLIPTFQRKTLPMNYHQNIGSLSNTMTAVKGDGNGPQGLRSQVGYPGVKYGHLY